MNTARNLERKLVSCPELDCADDQMFPPVPEEVFTVMESVYAEDPSVIYLFPFVRARDDGKRYAELYFWDSMLYPAACRRFVIFEGFRMKRRDEERFLYYTEHALTVSETDMKRLLDDAEKYFPQWHLMDYSPDRAGVALQHMYFASHRSGAREILFKAGLENIASHLECLPEYNMIGTSPESVVGYGLPLRLLRILNREEFISTMFHMETMLRARNVFRKYSGHIGNQPVSKGQWRYLEELYNPDGLFAGEVFNRTLYQRLSARNSEDTLPGYKSFFLLQAEYPELKKMKLPSPGMIRELSERFEIVRYYGSGESDMDDMIRRRKKRARFEYTGKEYVVRMPQNALDICKEAISQGNCVMDYIEEHGLGCTTILFVRKKESPERPCVTMEVKDREIQQVYGRFNCLPQKEVYVFLEEYAKKKKLEYDPYVLIMEETTELDDSEQTIELRTYAENFRKRAGRT